LASAPGDHPPDPARGLDRRTLIQRAAAAGALAWTTPVVVGSLASPAAAATYSGCFRAEWSVTAGTYALTRVTPANGSGCLDPNNWNNLPNYPGTITALGGLPNPGDPPGSVARFLFSLDESECVIDGRTVARKDQGNDCQTGTLSNACHTYAIVTSFAPDRVKMLIACDGTTCAGGTAC